MSCNEIERRYSVFELKLLIGLLDKVVKENENLENSSLLIDNVPAMKKILEKLIKYKSRLDKHIGECKNTINPNGFKDWLGSDNELYLQVFIGIKLTLEEYFVLYFYLENAVLDKNPYVNNKITLLKNELSREIASTASWKYLYKCMNE
ncbi:hypothetical protein LAV44_08970 [Clostridium sporogenes]|uniref:hypothetical protein n=1 Tax=Clostridium sporogenes TaxID=1509 RepID=UPI0022376427|nr:hypothetical protein [Clostridium sporogenes]MCW6075457.1 hypothetical protein [Clostridium sporogenes]